MKQNTATKHFRITNHVNDNNEHKRSNIGNWDEKMKSCFGRKKNGAIDGRLQERRRYIGETEKISAGTTV